jgi:hypothetical protein
MSSQRPLKAALPSEGGGGDEGEETGERRRRSVSAAAEFLTDMVVSWMPFIMWNGWERVKGVLI